MLPLLLSPIPDFIPISVFLFHSCSRFGRTEKMETNGCTALSAISFVRSLPIYYMALPPIKGMPPKSMQNPRRARYCGGVWGLNTKTKKKRRRLRTHRAEVYASEEVVFLVVCIYVPFWACMLVVYQFNGFQPSLFHYNS